MAKEKKKKEIETYEKLEKYLPTLDDWYPNYIRNTVRVFILCNIYNRENTGFVRIGVWGADDTGMEMDFKGSIEESIQIYEKWKVDIYNKLPNPLNKDYLTNIGFING